MGKANVLYDAEKWVLQAVLSLRLLAVKNGSEYGERSVKHVLYRIIEILAGKRIAETEKYDVNEIFRVLALTETAANRRLRRILSDRHRRIPEPLKNAKEITKAVNVLNLPAFPESPEPPLFIVEVYHCKETDRLLNDIDPSP